MLRRKKIFFTIVMTAIVFAVLEAFSWVAMSAASGEIVTYTDLRRWRSNVTAAADETVIERNPHDANILERRVIHPYFGYADPPLERKPVGGTDDQFDQHGFLPGAGPLIREASPNQTVIAIFGGSVARQFLERGGVEALRKALEASPAFAGKRIVIDSLGGYGFKQPQQLMALTYFLSLGAHFDVIVNLDGFNEVAIPGPELIAQGVFPFYPARWRTRAQAIDADPRLRLLAGEIAYRRAKRARSAEIFGLARWSMTAQLVWKYGDALQSAAIGNRELALQRLRSGTDEDFATQGPRAEYASEEQRYADLVRMWGRSAQHMQKLAAGNGAVFIEVLQPNQYVPGAKPLSDAERAIAWSDGEPYKVGVDKAFHLLRENGPKLGLPFYDLSLLFKDVQEPLFTDACCHFNEKGNRILGEKLAEIILQEMKTAEK